MTRLFYALIILFSATAVSAADVSTLYQGQAEVSSQAEQERNELTPTLLRQVVIKVVGDREAVNNADLTAVFADANRYVARYRYQHVNHDGDASTPDQLHVVMNFDRTAILNALERIGLPIWDQNRPEILVWVASDVGGSQRLFSDADRSEWLSLIRYHAKRRGLAIVMPLMDLQDQTQISFSDIWTANNQTLLQASERYGTPIVVSARFRGNDDALGISWQALLADQSENWQSEGDANTAIAAGIDELADRLGRRFAQVLGDAKPVQLRVTEVNSFDDYTRLMRYLDQLQGVSEINVQNMQNQQLQLTFNLQGEMDRFKQLLQLGRLLQPTEGEDEAVLHYRLAP